MINESPTSDNPAVNRLIEQADRLLIHESDPAGAAGLYSQALQLDPHLVAAHLGMAEANFALGLPQIAVQAATYVRRTAPDTHDAELAQAITLTIDRNLTPALDVLERLATTDPGRAYAHALRGYVLRCLNRDYDASLAEAKAARLSSNHDIKKLFPPVTPVTPPASPFASSAAASSDGTISPVSAPAPARPEWRPPTPVQRQVTRARIMAFNYPVGTYTIMAICVAVYLLQSAASGSFVSINPGANVTLQGEQVGFLVRQGEYWRLFTAMFIHYDFLHILFNMISLWNIGLLIERIYGLGRFLAIYFISGLGGGLLALLLTDPSYAMGGASGAIAGIFGALGAFFFAYRQQLGPVAQGFLNQWLFWLALNVVFNIGNSSLSWQAHLGGLLTGMVLGFVLAPQRFR